MSHLLYRFYYKKNDRIKSSSSISSNYRINIINMTLLLLVLTNKLIEKVEPLLTIYSLVEPIEKNERSFLSVFSLEKISLCVVMYVVLLCRDPLN